MLRRIATIAGVVAVLALLAGCIGDEPDRGDAHPQRLPVGIPTSVVAGCETSVGLVGASARATVVYRDSLGLHVRISNRIRNGSPPAIGSGGGMSNTESALLSCLNVVVGKLPVYPSDTSRLLLQWKYSTAVLWPCFAGHDANLGPTPSRATFLQGDPLQIDPFYLVRSPLSDVQTLQLQHDCPLIPAYLRSGSPSVPPSGKEG